MRVFIPDVVEPKNLPDSLTAEEVREVVVGMGYTSVENADIVTAADGSITFRRPSGGTKGKL